MFQKKKIVIAGTGHRPDKAGGYGEEARAWLRSRASKALESIIEKDYEISAVITGGAIGWDQSLAAASYGLGIPFYVYIPFKGQESNWPEPCQKRYKAMLKKSEQVKCCCRGEYETWKMQHRNKQMVNDADIVLAFWNREEKGGTYNCINYANQRLRYIPIINCYEEPKNN